MPLEYPNTNYRSSALAELYTQGGRLPAWTAYPPIDRRSPGNDADSPRRRPRARHGGPRTSPSARTFGGSTANGSSQSPVRHHSPLPILGRSTSRQGVRSLTWQQYPPITSTQLPGQNNRHSATLSGPSNGAVFENQLPSPSFYSGVNTPPDPFQNPLAGISHSPSRDHYRGPAGSQTRADQTPLSPTIGGPEVDMTNYEQTAPRRASSYQPL